MRIALRALCSFFVLLLLSSCNGTKLPLPDPLPISPIDFRLPVIDSNPVVEKLNKVFAENEAWNSAPVSGVKISGGKTYVVLDDSYSIRHHLQDESNSLSYTDFMDTIFNSVITDATYYTLCQGEQKDLDALRNNIHLETFYKQSNAQLYTPLYSFLSKFFDEHQPDGDNLYVILSDMVVSGEVDPRGIPQDLIKLIDTHFLSGEHSKDTTIGVIGAKLEYCGNYSDLPKLNIDERGLFHSDNIIATLIEGEELPTVYAQYVNNGNSVKRPYYALVMGNSEKVADFIGKVTDAYNKLPYPNAEKAILGVYQKDRAEMPTLEMMLLPELTFEDGDQDPLKIRVAEISDSGILSNILISSPEDVDVRKELYDKVPVLLVSDRMDYDITNSFRIRIPIKDIGKNAVAKGMWYTESLDPTYEHDEDAPPPPSGMVEAKYLIDFGEKNGYREFGLQRTVIDTLVIDKPMFFVVELESKEPTVKFSYDSSELPSWIGQWDLNLGVYLDEAYHNVDGKYEFILGRSHTGRSYTAGRTYSQHDRTPFIKNIFNGLSTKRLDYLVDTVNEDKMNAETKSYKQVFCFGVVKRLSYTQYLTDMGVSVEYVRPYYIEDFGFAFPEELKEPEEILLPEGDKESEDYEN